MKKLLFIFSSLFSSLLLSAQNWTDNGSYSTTSDKIGIGTSAIGITHTGVNDFVIGNGTGSRGLVVNAGSGNDAILAFAKDYVMKARWQFNNSTENLYFHRQGVGNQFTITPSGNVGIGTNPISKLHVHESTYLGSNNLDNVLLTRISGKAGNTFMNNLWLRRDASGSDWLTARLHDGISVDASYLNPGTNTRTWWERDPYNKIQSWGNANTTYMSLDNGKLGIGTAPTAKLEVRGTIKTSINSTRSLTLNSNGDGNSYINYSGGNSTSRIGFQIDGSSKLSILNNGAVGIGTTTTGTHKLAVEGTIGAREIKVEATGWSDFVFYNDYNLPSLEEVEKFISQNNHLPEIPSEAEVLEEGINLGEMNAKLLQKIEELTLYLIEQNKEIKNLKKEVNQLKSN